MKHGHLLLSLPKRTTFQKHCKINLPHTLVALCIFCTAYILDADEAGKPDLSAFFIEVKQDAHKHAERAKQLLGISPK